MQRELEEDSTQEMIGGNALDRHESIGRGGKRSAPELLVFLYRVSANRYRVRVFIARGALGHLSVSWLLPEAQVEMEVTDHNSKPRLFLWILMVFN